METNGVTAFAVRIAGCRRAKAKSFARRQGRVVQVLSFLWCLCGAFRFSGSFFTQRTPDGSFPSFPSGEPSFNP
jgi:hypothetical protein